MSDETKKYIRLCVPGEEPINVIVNQYAEQISVRDLIAEMWLARLNRNYEDQAFALFKANLTCRAVHDGDGNVKERMVRELHFSKRRIPVYDGYSSVYVTALVADIRFVPETPRYRTCY